MIMAESGQTIRQALQRRVGDRYRLSIQAYDVVVGEKKEVNTVFCCIVFAFCNRPF